MNHSEIQLCKIYHLNNCTGDLQVIANILMWSLGKTIACHKTCIDKRYIIEGGLSDLALITVKSSEESDIKGGK